MTIMASKFLSTPSARRATRQGLLPRSQSGISIHALREEGDRDVRGVADLQQISIHALREEGDVDEIREGCPCDISIHALREEGDTGADFLLAGNIDFYPRPPRGGRRSPILGIQYSHANFYPRPPRGGRPSLGGAAVATAKFLSTPSARRATHLPSDWFPDLRYFYPRPPRGGRRSLQQQRPA